MSKKTLSNDDIIDAIASKFGSIDAYADFKDTSRQNIYNKISRKAKKFIRELIRDGVIFPEGSDINIVKAQTSIQDKYRVGDTINNTGAEKYLQCLEKLNSCLEENAVLKSRIKELENEIENQRREKER